MEEQINTDEINDKTTDEQLNYEENLTPQEIEDRRLHGYKGWLASLSHQVATGTITEEEKDRKISRAMSARDLLAARYHGKAYTDMLTGLPNRRSFEESYARLGKKGPIGILILDIDFFKQFNDTWGHAVGDAVLIETGVRLVDSVRQAKIKPLGTSRRTDEVEEETDLVARFGGEEIVIMLPGITTEEALFHKAEQIRQIINNEPYDFSHDNTKSSATVSVSIGGGVYRGGDRKTLFNQIDKQALYRSKEQGRNRVTILNHTPQVEK